MSEHRERGFHRWKENLDGLLDEVIKKREIDGVELRV
jgi:hypothetical protein